MKKLYSVYASNGDGIYTERVNFETFEEATAAVGKLFESGYTTVKLYDGVYGCTYTGHYTGKSEEVNA